MTTTTLDRVVHWALDVDGDMYGDERERLRWYEGISTAASLQWIAVPWAAAIMVWPLGRSSVVPLAVILVLMYAPMLVCMAYMRRRRVDTTPRSMRPKTMVAGLLGGLPYVVFLVGAVAAYQALDDSVATGAAIGGVVGAAMGGVVMWLRSRKRRAVETAPLGDED